jgi:hypothetical protein
MCGGGGVLAHTGGVEAHPVTRGVRGVWYPTQPAYNGAMGAPIVVDSNWSVLIAGSNTSHSAPINMSGPQGGANAGNTPWPPNAYQRDHNVSAPSLFAVREWGKGRVALLNQWRQFSVGSGSRWLYDDVVLSRGMRGLPSDVGQLLENAWHWLAEPSLNKGILGGWVHGADSYSWPNDTPTALAHATDVTNEYDRSQLLQDPIDPTLRTARGLIGARTALTGGTGTVEQFAAAAAAAGLDFLVFLEEFTALAPNNGSKFERLLADCAAHSSAELLLLPGYRIKNNLARGAFAASRGNDMMVFGPKVQLPPAAALTPDGTQLNLQQFAPNSTTNVSLLVCALSLIKLVPAQSLLTANLTVSLFG